MSSCAQLNIQHALVNFNNAISCFVIQKTRAVGKDKFCIDETVQTLYYYFIE